MSNMSCWFYDSMKLIVNQKSLNLSFSCVLSWKFVIHRSTLLGVRQCRSCQKAVSSRWTSRHPRRPVRNSRRGCGLRQVGVPGAGSTKPGSLWWGATDALGSSASGSCRVRGCPRPVLRTEASFLVCSCPED